MLLSVIICSYNRAHNLPACIDQLLQQRNVEDLDWEIVLVDNNSSDDTAAVVASLSARSRVPIRYLFERQQGLSHARNRGIRDSDSRYLLFIDDDILVAPDWLRAIYDTFTAHDCDAVGGKIEIEAPQRLPKWIRPDMYGFLGQRDFGEQAFAMNGRDQFPFGGNMAFQRRVADRIGLFDTAMGRKGSGARREDLFKGEETDFFHRLADAGGTMHYQPRAAVIHRILPYQLKKGFFRTIHFNAGLQAALSDRHDHPRRLWGAPRFVYGQLARAAGRYLLRALREGPARAFRQQMNVYYFLGNIRGYRQAMERDRPEEQNG